MSVKTVITRDYKRFIFEVNAVLLYLSKNPEKSGMVFCKILRTSVFNIDKNKKVSLKHIRMIFTGNWNGC